MVNAIHQCFPTYVDIVFNKNQLITARRLIDELYKHNNTEWYSTILLETEDLSDSNVLNYLLEYAGKSLPSHVDYCKFVCFIKYSTKDGFDGNSFNS